MKANHGHRDFESPFGGAAVRLREAEDATRFRSPVQRAHTPRSGQIPDFNPSPTTET